MCFPPSSFVAVAMEVPVVEAAERHDIFVADLLRKASRLGKSQMMGMGRLPAADGAWQFAYLL
jgi:hypothetical protein